MSGSIEEKSFINVKVSLTLLSSRTRFPGKTSARQTLMVIGKRWNIKDLIPMHEVHLYLPVAEV